MTSPGNTLISGHLYGIIIITELWEYMAHCGTLRNIIMDYDDIPSWRYNEPTIFNNDMVNSQDTTPRSMYIPNCVVKMVAPNLWISCSGTGPDLWYYRTLWSCLARTCFLLNLHSTLWVWFHLTWVRRILNPCSFHWAVGLLLGQAVVPHQSLGWWLEGTALHNASGIVINEWNPY